MRSSELKVKNKMELKFKVKKWDGELGFKVKEWNGVKV